MPAGDGAQDAPRRWGSGSALVDDEEARRRLLDAAVRCIVRRGDVGFRMAEVADEAGVARSTVYRYFQTRGDLIVGVLLARTDATLANTVAALRDPADAARSIPSLILDPVELVAGGPLNEALASTPSRSIVSLLELGSEQLLDVVEDRVGPLLSRWQSDGQLHADLDVRETLRWMNAVAVLLLAPPWRDRPRAAKQELVERYVVRALLTAAAQK